MTYIVGDLHGSYNSAKENKFLHNLGEDDVLIVLGDFGWTWDKASVAKFSLPCTTLFIDGNHDNFDILDNLEEADMYGSKVGVLKDRVYHLKRGNIYTINGKTYLTFGGANSIDKGYRIPRLSWWEREIPSYAECSRALESLKSVGYRVDFLLTHTCSEEVCAELMHYPYRIEDATERMITAIVKEIEDNGGSFDKNLFGHHHVFSNLNDRYIALYMQAYCVEDEKFLYF